MSKLFTLAVLLLSLTSLLDAKAVNNLEDKILISQRTERSYGNGLTFVKAKHTAEFGVDLIGCRNWFIQNGPLCNAYVGDTACTESRPVLCTKVDDSPRPAYVLNPGEEFYYGWNRGHVATTVPVKGSKFSNHAAVDAYCAKTFGKGWRVATFHDGYFISGMNGTMYAGSSWTNNTDLQQNGGWHFYAYGDVRNDTRFWVHIKDQPSTCWTQ